jgi:hypothetical protein
LISICAIAPIKVQKNINRKERLAAVRADIGEVGSKNVAELKEMIRFGRATSILGHRVESPKFLRHFRYTWSNVSAAVAFAA